MILPQNINYGGFVSPSTIDWPGKAVSVIFFRGCSLSCTYCHNQAICGGLDQRPVSEIEGMIKESSFLTSGVICSGGECTEQQGALLEICGYCKDMGIPVGIQTNGTMPAVLELLIRKGMIEYVSLDIKSTWVRYYEVIGDNTNYFVPHIRESLARLTQYHLEGKLKELRVAYTNYNPSILGEVRAQVDPRIKFVVQEKR